MPRMAINRLHLLTIPLAAASLALAACGGGDDSSAASPEDARAEFREAALAFAQCMREHGVDMPDPEPGSGGIQLMAGPDADRATMDRAQKACQKHLDKARPPELSDEQESELRERALEQARCMREHGIDVPDPTFGEDGRVQMRMPESAGNDPAFEDALEDCAERVGLSDSLEQER
jgi:hypothetical protein